MATSTIQNYTLKTGDIVSVGTVQSVLIQLVKYGNVVYGTIVDGVSGSRVANTHLGTLPEGYRPKIPYDFVDSYGKKRCLIAEDGKVTLSEISSTYIRGSFCFVTP